MIIQWFTHMFYLLIHWVCVISCVMWKTRGLFLLTCLFINKWHEYCHEVYYCNRWSQVISDFLYVDKHLSILCLLDNRNPGNGHSSHDNDKNSGSEKKENTQFLNVKISCKFINVCIKVCSWRLFFIFYAPIGGYFSKFNIACNN